MSESTKTAFLFPGQGSQKVGMGQAWADQHAVAREAFEEAGDVLGWDVAKLCFEGPEEDLQLTANTQPALVTVSVAMLRVATGAGLRADAVAGHSLGEYAAHVAAGTLEFADALRLVRRRGELMQEAVPVGVGAMVALIGLDDDAVTALIAAALEARAESGTRGEVLTVANLNAPGQTVIAGHREAALEAAERARDHGARKAVVLPVSAPFHSPLMAPARVGLEPMLQSTDFADPSMPVVTNIDAAPVTAGAPARDALVRQVDGPVRWVASIERLREDGVEHFVEVGAGNVLTGLGRRIDREARWSHLPSPAAIENLVSG